MSNPDFESLRIAVKEKKELYSIFDRISLGQASGKLNNLHQPRTLSKNNIVAKTGDLALEDLEKDLNKVEKLNDFAQTDTFFYLLQKYGWRIGTPDDANPNNGAVAYCDAFRVKKAIDGHKELILLKGDFTGIQKYIYGNIQPKRAGGLAKIAKKLRGRSVIVSLMTDFIANVILRELGLSAYHLLFAGGGHFNLLLPNTPSTQGALKALKIELERQMQARFGDNLQLAIAWKVFSVEEIENNTGLCFSTINTELERQKHLQNRDRLSLLFYAEGATQSHVSVDKRNEEWEISIGERFPRRNLVIETVSKTPIGNKDGFPEIATFEMSAQYSDSAELPTFELNNNTYSLFVAENFGEAREMLNEMPDLLFAQVFSLNETNFLPESGNWKNNIAFGFRFIGRTVPTIEDETTGLERPQTFEEIVAADAIKMLGALRLDVDDLGFIFSQGIKQASLSEIVCLSREMQYFFSIHLDQLASQRKAQGDKDDFDLYLIYSGGDDAFAVGKWDNVIHFTIKLYEDFQDFVFENPDVHFSAGIFMGSPHYPVGRFSEDAGRLQKDAKEHVKNEWRNKKNRISVFNHVMGWDAFASKIKLGETFFNAMDNPKDPSKFNSAFVYRILNLVKSSFYERAGTDRDGNAYRRGSVNIERFGRNVAGLRYLFARQGLDEKRARGKVEEIEKALLGDFLKSFDFGDEEKIQSTRDYLVSLNYAIFKKRGRSDNQQSKLNSK